MVGRSGSSAGGPRGRCAPDRHLHGDGHCGNGEFGRSGGDTRVRECTRNSRRPATRRPGSGQGSACRIGPYPAMEPWTSSRARSAATRPAPQPALLAADIWSSHLSREPRRASRDLSDPSARLRDMSRRNREKRAAKQKMRRRAATGRVRTTFDAGPDGLHEFFRGLRAESGQLPCNTVAS
jgi:hypothetical protein